MVELCLMASHGCPPAAGVGFSTEHASTKVFDARFLFFFFCGF